MISAKEKLVVVLIVMMIAFCSVYAFIASLENDNGSGGNSDGGGYENMTDLGTFSSYDDIENFLDTNTKLGSSGSFRNLDSNGLYRWKYDYNVNNTNSPPPVSYEEKEVMMDAGDDDGDGGSGSGDYSKTNVQEEGVDEGDIVKNDGGYAYIVSKDRKKVIIVDVYPADTAEIISEIEVEDGTIIEIYLVGDKLVVLGRKGNYYGYYYYGRRSYYPSSSAETFVNVYDIENRDEPLLSRADTMNGSYISSRMIGNHFYLIGRQSTREITNEKELAAAASEIYYVDDYDYGYSYTNVFSINILTTSMKPEVRSILMGSSGEVYVSQHNIYLTYGKRLSWVDKKEMEIEKAIMPMLPEITSWRISDTINSDLTRFEKLDNIDRLMGEYIENLTEDDRENFYEEWQEEEDKFTEDIAEDLERTVIYRIAIKKGSISFQAKGDVPGYILNRFSMGEYEDHFRIATTTGHVSRTGLGTAKNHIFVLDMTLQITGSIRDIAPGERIYSARFMGSRAYLVTFDKVDPFFVMDLTDPYNPFILGELKIPGYSDYLHPYDENHVIGLGKETVLAEGGSFSWYQGVKLSLFDVTDVSNPKEISKYIIGDRGTYSPAQSDPHAFLFSRSKNLLVIPISLYEIDQTKYPHGASDNTHGQFVWEGAYVFHVSAADGFVLKGRVSHHDEDEIREDYGWYGDYDGSIKRSFYIDDVIYTVSNSMIKANDLDRLEEIIKIEFLKGDE